MKFKYIFAVLGAAIGIILIKFILPWLGILVNFILMPNSPKPDIKYGEFDFTLQYEINGEIKTIEDTAICEFDGFGQRSTAGQDRKWKTYLKSGNDKAFQEDNEHGALYIPMLDVSDRNIMDESGCKVLSLFFIGGTGHYYMGDDESINSREAQDFNDVYYVYQKQDGTTGHNTFGADVAFEKIGVRLVDWEVEEPIENEFKYLKWW